VYLGDDFLKVDGEIIPLQNVITIEKTHFYYYEIVYWSNNKAKSFIFLAGAAPFIEPKYVKKIKSHINN